MMNERINVGYKIIKSIKIGDIEYVLGEKHTESGPKYVTWRCFNETNYQFGNYFESFLYAYLDLHRRGYIELEFIIKDLEEEIKDEEK